MHLTVISKHITALCDLLQAQDDIFNCGTRSQVFLFICLTQRTNSAFLFSHFASEERAVCLSRKKRRIQPLSLKGVRGTILENRGGRLQLDKVHHVRNNKLLLSLIPLYVYFLFG